MKITHRKITSSTSITASELVDNGQVQPGLVFNQDGHEFKVTSVSPDHKTCQVTERWLNEDTLKLEKQVTTCNIVKEGDVEYLYDPEYAEYAKPGQKDYSWWARKYATGADNYPYEWGKYSDEEDDYTPSATRGDYGPSNPWDAPGMSMSDFIGKGDKIL